MRQCTESLTVTAERFGRRQRSKREQHFILGFGISQKVLIFKGEQDRNDIFAEVAELYKDKGYYNWIFELKRITLTNIVTPNKTSPTNNEIIQNYKEKSSFDKLVIKMYADWQKYPYNLLKNDKYTSYTVNGKEYKQLPFDIYKKLALLQTISYYNKKRVEYRYLRAAILICISNAKIYCHTISEQDIEDSHNYF